MTEAVLWSTTARPLLVRLGLDPVRVENGLEAGTPDVNYLCGWIELKDVPAWPMRSRWPVSVEFRREQCPWLARRWRAGGLCFVLLRVASQLMLFDGWSAQRVRDGLPRRELLEAALWTPETRAGQSSDVRLSAILLGREDWMDADFVPRWRRALACTDELTFKSTMAGA